MAQIIADWTPLGKDTFYRKSELYSMEWSNKVNLNEFIVTAAPFGGPIAIIKDHKKIIKIHGSSVKPTVHIFSAVGKHIASIKWAGGRIVHLAWSCYEDLLIVQDDGSVCIYDMFGTFQSTFSMGQEAKDTKVLDCKVFNNVTTTAVAVLTTTFRIFAVNSIRDARIRRMPEIPGLDIPPACWTILPLDRQNFQVPNSQFLVGKESELYLLDAGETHAQQQFPEFNTPVKSYLELAVSNDSKRVALFTSSGIIWIGTSDLHTKYCEFDTKCPNRPDQLLWCATEAVVGYWENDLLVVGLEKDFVNYTFDSPVHLVAEIDGIRIISNTTHEFFQKVPDVVRDIFRIGSMDPGAILLEACKEFKKKSHRADEYIREIRGQLEVAVMQCIEAAGHEYQPSIQKMLLRAASFGKCFIPELNPEPFQKMCQTLRVLNAVRDYTLGLPLTHNQLKCLTMPVLIDRLVHRRQYSLAIHICQYLKIPDAEGASRILAHWACYKVKQKEIDEEQVAIDISKKLGCTPGISYAEIASKAAEFGRTQLAIKLLDFEPRASEQVPLLIKLNQAKQAMTKAINSGDTDLIYLVIFDLRDSLPLGDFQMEIRKFQYAQALYIKYCKEQDLELLRDVYYLNDDFQAEGNCKVVQSYQPQMRVDLRIQTLHSAVESYKAARNEFAASQTEEQIRLMRYQLKLEEKFNVDYLDKSLHDTVYSLLLSREHRLAEELKKEFKISEKHFAWTKLRAFGELTDWIELDKFSKSKKCPVGFEAFVDICLRYKNKMEALKYLPKVKVENKVKYLLKAGLMDEAVTTAFEMKDISALEMVEDKCGSGNRALLDKIQAMKAQLGVK